MKPQGETPADPPAGSVFDLRVSESGRSEDQRGAVGSVALGAGDVLRTGRPVVVSESGERNFHGPTACRTPDGDLLLCHQDSLLHGGKDCHVHQWRSADGGDTWSDEAAVADLRGEGLDARFGEYGVTDDGGLLLFVQVVDPRGTATGAGGNLQIRGSLWYSSADGGRSWKNQGLVDSDRELGVLMARGVVRHDGEYHFGAYSRDEGLAWYVSDNGAASWCRRSVVFPASHSAFADLVTGGPPFYPNGVFLPDGSVLAVCYHTRTNSCWFRRSSDRGRTWGDLVERPDVDLWAPRLVRWGDLLVLSGRSIADHTTSALFSSDEGTTWEGRLIIDSPGKSGNYGYSYPQVMDRRRMWVFTSSPVRSDGHGDIIGVPVVRS